MEAVHKSPTILAMRIRAGRLPSRHLLLEDTREIFPSCSCAMHQDRCRQDADWSLGWCCISTGTPENCSGCDFIFLPQIELASLNVYTNA